MSTSDKIAGEEKKETAVDPEWGAEAGEIEDGRDDFEEEVDETKESEVTGEPLDELEAEERGMLTADEASETISIDEEAALRDIMIAERAMAASDADGAHEDEFVCQSCFLVKAQVQMASKRKKICIDCAA
jgi:chromatin segregation and condensation protein Rec8/ScpA/Scc1 (kleisin family)